MIDRDGSGAVAKDEETHSQQRFYGQPLPSIDLINVEPVRERREMTGVDSGEQRNRGELFRLRSCSCIPPPEIEPAPFHD